MKVISYVGIEGAAIVIERPTDLYALIDWFQSAMMELAESEAANSGEAKMCADYCSTLMDKIEEDGFGSFDDVENIKWS